VLRAGVAGGVLSTIAVAGAAGTANAEPVTDTIEMPTLSVDLSNAVAQSAQATQQIALTMQTRAQLQSQEDAAIKHAATAAKKAKAEAEAKAKAKAEAAAKKKAEEAARAKAAKAAADRAAAARTEAVSASSSSGSTSAATATATASTSHATGSAGAVVAYVEARIGDAYIMGATGPNAFDCSGLVQAAYGSVGVSLPRVSQDQSTAGTQVPLGNVQPGDILYWGTAGNATHVAIYVGDGKFVGAQNPSDGVAEHDLSWDEPSGAVRVL
jgi:cell wall-associated NlpC family hydrolase